MSIGLRSSPTNQNTTDYLMNKQQQY